MSEEQNKIEYLNIEGKRYAVADFTEEMVGSLNSVIKLDEQIQSTQKKIESLRFESDVLLKAREVFYGEVVTGLKDVPESPEEETSEEETCGQDVDQKDGAE